VYLQEKEEKKIFSRDPKKEAAIQTRRVRRIPFSLSASQRQPVLGCSSLRSFKHGRKARERRSVISSVRTAP
jgi:hypothetical protein